MSNMTKIIAAFALATLLGTLAFTSAQSRRGDGPPPGVGPGHPPDGLNPRVLDQLNLTDLQRTQIETLHDTARAEAEKFGDQLKANHEQIEALVTGGAFDETQARKLLATKAQLMTELDVIHLRTEAAVYGLLTTEQRAQAEQLKQARPPFPPPPFRGERPVDGK